MAQDCKSSPENVHGLGLGLRFAFLEELLEACEEGKAQQVLPEARFLEVSPENYMRRGGFFPYALEVLAEHFSMLSHGLMMNLGGPSPLDRDYLEQLRIFIKKLGAKAHSDHLCWSGVEGQTLHDLLPLPLGQANIDRVVQNILQAQDALGVPMSIENISYYALPGGTQGLAEAQMVAQILESADCGLLLDVNNLWVNAQNHGFDPEDYLDQLPLQRVTQLHVAGGERLELFDDLWIDTHGDDVPAPVVALMQKVIARIGPRPVLYERDHNIPALPELRQQLRGLQEAYDQALGDFCSANAALDDSRTEPRRIESPNTPKVPTTFKSHTQDPSVLATLGLFSRVILDQRAKELLQPEQRSSFTHHFQSWLHSLPLEAQDCDQSNPDSPAGLLADMGPARLAVYRKLVHNSICSAIRAFLPYTLDFRGKQDFHDDLQLWLEGPGPRSKYLRDLPVEFVQFISIHWTKLDELGAFLIDFARYELLECELEAAASAPLDAATPDESRPLELSDELVIDPLASIHSFRYPVHEIVSMPEAARPPIPWPQRATTLLVYRDEEHELRYLQLSPMAESLWRSWQESLTLEQSIRRAALAQGAQTAEGRIEDEFLARVSALIAEFAERGVVKGPRKIATTPA